MLSPGECDYTLPFKVQLCYPLESAISLSPGESAYIFLPLYEAFYFVLSEVFRFSLAFPRPILKSSPLSNTLFLDVIALVKSSACP